MTLWGALAVWAAFGMIATADVEKGDDGHTYYSWQFSLRGEPFKVFAAGPLVWLLIAAKYLM